MASSHSLRFEFGQIGARHADRIAHSLSHHDGKIAFVENKPADLAHVAELLAHCEHCNQWANRGPLFWALAEAYHNHMNLSATVAVTPCANGGIALESLARYHEAKQGRQLRWVGSAFSFSNLARGWFSGIRILDCDAQGMLDLAELQALDPAEYDGFVVTNIFGLWRDFGRYIEFARKSGKAMLIDNAAGIDRAVPDWPYQAFSLHHTKPYGAGEGGLFLSPRDEAEEIFALLNYGAFDGVDRSLWLNNGKISDIACAFHLDRLARHDEWGPHYHAQAERVHEIALSLGLRPLVPGPLDRPAMSRPYIAPKAAILDRLRQSERLQFGKYYQPLRDLPTVSAIYSGLVNIPTHPDVAQVSDFELAREIEVFVLRLGKRVQATTSTADGRHSTDRVRGSW